MDKSSLYPNENKRILELLLKLGVRDNHEREYMDALLPYFRNDEQLVNGSCEAVSYLARLFLCANGNTGNESVTSKPLVLREYVSVITTIPNYFSRLFLPPFESNLSGEVRPFDFMDVDSATGGVVVQCSIKRADYPNVGTDDLIRLMCSRVFCGIFELFPRPMFHLDTETLLPKRQESYFFADVADEIIRGNVGACGKCGRPVYIGDRSNAKPFCNKGHQNRYREKAMRMKKHGASTDEVAEAFPYINRETIANW